MASTYPATTAPPSTLTLRKQFDLIRAELLLERSNFDETWRTLGDYFLPTRTRFQASDRNRNVRRGQSNKTLIDSAPRFAVRTLQSGLHAGLTSPARPWMRLTTPDPDLADSKRVKEWLHTVTQRILDTFLKSNLYNALPILYGDLGVFGTGAIGVLEDDEDLMRAYSYPIGSYSIGLDARGVATTYVMETRRTVSQLIAEFGFDRGSTTIHWERFSRQVKNLYDQRNYETPIDICWYVTPNHEQNPRAFAARDRMKWRSYWLEVGAAVDFNNGAEGFLRVGGFNTFPVLVPRWGVTGEDTYGTDCPGMDVLGDNKSLQVQQRKKAKAIEKSIDPPLVGGMALKTQKTSLLSGDVTYTDEREGMKGLRAIHEVRLEGLQYLLQDMSETRERIDRGFYVDLFLMLTASDRMRGTQPPTAREIDERHEEKLLALGPMLERTNDELLDPLVDRAFSILLSHGAIPEPPRELMGVDLKVEYISMMSQAQKLIGVTGADRLLMTATQMAEIWPDAPKKLKAFAIIDGYADMLGVNPTYVRTDAEAKQLVDAEQQAIAAQQRAEQLKTTGQGMQAMAQAPVNAPGQQPTALDALLAGAGA